MATPPNPQQAVDQATAQTYRNDTPGLNSVISAWGALQDFTGAWANSTYSGLAVVTGLIGEFAI